jgi:hypothetical protein
MCWLAIKQVPLIFTTTIEARPVCVVTSPLLDTVVKATSTEQTMKNRSHKDADE